MKFSSSLKSSRGFKRIYAKGQHVVSRRMVLYCRRNNIGTNRLGITVTTKLGSAVCRNRIRRRLKEIYRLNEAGFLRGYDIVVVARSAIVFAEYKEMEADFLSLAEALGIRE